MKKLILAVAAVAALAPTSSAFAANADTLELSGPSATVVNLFTGGTSGGGPVVIAGQQLDGIQANGHASYKERGADREGKVTANDVNGAPNDPVLTFVVDTDQTPAPETDSLSIFVNNLEGNKYRLEGKTQDGDDVPNLSECGAFVVGLAPADVILASLTQGGDPADLILARPNGCN